MYWAHLDHLVYLYLLVAAALSLMMVAGLAKHALDTKRTGRICPACGRDTRDCRCLRG